MRLFVLLLSLIILSSCTKKSQRRLRADVFKGKTFDFTTPYGSDVLEFNDSTYRVLNRNGSHDSYYIQETNDSTILYLEFFGSYKLAIDSFSENQISGRYFLKNEPRRFTLKEKPVQWDKSLLQGKWVNEFYLDPNDQPMDINEFPPFPPDPDGLQVKWPPTTEFKKDTLHYDYWYSTKIDAYQINHSNEYITLNVSDFLGRENTLWKIKTLNDSTLIVDQYYSDEGRSGIEENVRFVKKN
jgi:hypothetical protein